MKYKLELDFQFYRFYTFSLLAAVLTTAIAFYNFKYNNNLSANNWAYVCIAFTIIFLIANIKFLTVYFKLRKELK